MRSKRWIAPTVLLVSLGLVGAACGSDNKSSSSSTAAPASTSASTAAATTAAGGATTTAGGAATTAAGGAAAEGPVIPDKGTGKYGQDPSNPNLYVGPNGFSIDISKCPS